MASIKRVTVFEQMLETVSAYKNQLTMGWDYVYPDLLLPAGLPVGLSVPSQPLARQGLAAAAR